MICGIFHAGSGMGNQLFRYIATRVLATDLGVPFGMDNHDNFKGKDFMNLDWGKEIESSYTIQHPIGKLILDIEKIFINPFEGIKLWEAPAYYDPEVNFIEDGTVIDATCAQDERYWGHKLNEIRKWLKVDPINLDEHCIINFRGGEYTVVPDLFLTKEYWKEAIQIVKDKGITDFEVHTDDLSTAKDILGDLLPWETNFFSNIKSNWQAVRYAKHLILSNSAFGILPALLNENVKEVIAPRYWARRNIKQWSMPSNYYKKFQYI